MDSMVVHTVYTLCTHGVTHADSMPCMMDATDFISSCRT